MLQNPFQARASKVSSRQWDSQVSSSVLHSRAFTDLEIHKPLYLITDSPSYGYVFPRPSKVDNPFYSSRSALADKSQSGQKVENPFLTATPYRYQPTDITHYNSKGLTNWEKLVYLQRSSEESEPVAMNSEGKEELREMRNLYSFDRQGRDLQEDQRDSDRFTRQMTESSRQPPKRTEQPKTLSNTQKAPIVRKESLRLEFNPEPAESISLKTKFMEYQRKMSNHQPDSPKGWNREQYTTTRPAASPEDNGFRKAEWTRLEPKDTKYFDGSSIINKLENIPESRQSNSLEPNIRMTDSKVYEYRGNEKDFTIPEGEEYEGFDFSAPRPEQLPEHRKELHETSKFKKLPEKEIPLSIKYKNTVFELVPTC